MIKITLTGALLLSLAGAASAAEAAKEKPAKPGCPMHAQWAKDEPAAPKKKGKGGCKHCAGHKTAKSDAAKPGVYACSMGDYAGAMTKDGKCPKCGMDLALKK